jgi:peptidoglycan-associated lipoprotein
MRLNPALTGSLTGLSTLALLTLLVAGCASPAQVVKPEVDARDAVAAATPPPAPAPVSDPAAGRAAPACTISRVHFAFDSALLDASARTELQVVASCLEQRRPAAVVIEGHTDERGTSGYNVALGNRRADSVRAYLKDLGVGAALQVVSFGKELPLVGGAGEPAWSQNRRAELRLPGDQRSDGQRVSN